MTQPGQRLPAQVQPQPGGPLLFPTVFAGVALLEYIAEGIETEAQLRTVIGLGVDLLQGYYLSRPAAVPAPIAPAAQAVIDQLEHQRFNPLGL